MPMKKPKTFAIQNINAELISEQKSDGSRNFTQVARTSRSGRPKTVDSEVTLQAIEVNPMSDT